MGEIIVVIYRVALFRGIFCNDRSVISFVSFNMVDVSDYVEFYLNFVFSENSEN